MYRELSHLTKLPSYQARQSNMAEAELSPYRLLAVGSVLLAIGTAGFYSIDGMIVDDAGGHHLINSFYCSVMTLNNVSLNAL